MNTLMFIGLIATLFLSALLLTGAVIFSTLIALSVVFSVVLAVLPFLLAGGILLYVALKLIEHV